jgi:hypothetical protein
MAGKPVDYSLPGSFIVNTLRSYEFQEAIDQGIQEVIGTGVLQKGIDRFVERAEQNGLAGRAFYSLVLELARLIITWYFEQHRKSQSSA